MPCEDPNRQGVRDLDDLLGQLVDETANFFVVDKQWEGHDVAVDGWGGVDESRRVAEDGLVREAHA